jgi:hypothetical protein
LRKTFYFLKTIIHFWRQNIKNFLSNLFTESLSPRQILHYFYGGRDADCRSKSKETMDGTLLKKTTAEAFGALIEVDEMEIRWWKRKRN